MESGTRRFTRSLRRLAEANAGLHEDQAAPEGAEVQAAGGVPAAADS
jgi:hypothetical protein